jgi:hypothetical protein
LIVTGDLHETFGSVSIEALRLGKLRTADTPPQVTESP